MKKNGWEKPYDLLQIITWIFFPFLVIGYYLFYIPFFNDLTSILLGLIYGIIVVQVIYFSICCTGKDPIDDNIINTTLENVGMTAPTNSQIYCNVCMRYVYKKSRHCRLCNKCVQYFDHHCKWLNNCIGEKNYKLFIITIIMTLLLLLFQSISGIYLILYGFLKSDETNKQMASAYGCYDKKDNEYCNKGQYKFSRFALLGVQIGFLCIVLPATILILQLFLFHLKLSYDNMTTYEYIVHQRKSKLNKSHQHNNRQINHLIRNESPRLNSDHSFKDIENIQENNNEIEIAVLSSTTNHEGLSYSINNKSISNKNDKEKDNKKISSNTLHSRNENIPTRGFGKHLHHYTDTFHEIQSPIMKENNSIYVHNTSIREEKNIINNTEPLQ